jgi:quercetin dioxygenase-like cupin family protein
MGVNAQARVRHVPARTGRSFAVLGQGVTLLDEPADNGDALMLFEVRTPSGGMVPPHTEDNHEAFYVIEGIFELEVEGELFRCGAGDFLSIQPGTVHSFRNAGPGWARMLTLTSPGSQHQRFFESLGEPLEPGADPPPLTGPPDFERVDRLGRESGIHFLPPPAAGG